MSFDLNAAFEILERTPGLLSVWLRDLGDDWIRADEGAGSFSPFDVVGHLIQGEIQGVEFSAFAASRRARHSGCFSRPFGSSAK